MDYRTTSIHKFRTKLGFKQYDVILTKEQLILTKVMSSFEGENMQIQYNALSYRIDLYFYDYKLVIEIDENGQSKGNIKYEMKRQKAIEQELCCQFIRIDPDKEDFDIFRAIQETFRHIKQSTKKTLKSLRQLGFKSDNVTRSKPIKFIIKKRLLKKIPPNL